MNHDASQQNYDVIIMIIVLIKKCCVYILTHLLHMMRYISRHLVLDPENDHGDKNVKIIKHLMNMCNVFSVKF